MTIGSRHGDDMSNSTTLTVRMAPELKARLGELADNTSRSKSFLATEAIEDYVQRELAIIEGIERGLEDARAGRVTPHADVMADADRIIAAASEKQ